MAEGQKGVKKQRKPRLVSSRKIKDSRLRPYCGLLRVDASKSKANSTNTKPKSSDSVKFQGNMLMIAFDGDEEDLSQPVANTTPVNPAENHSNVRKSQVHSRTTTPSTIINGFIGFRSYYCKFFDSTPQSKVSTAISKAWTEGANQDFWCNKAARYNFFRPNNSFVHWLKASSRYIPDTTQVLRIMGDNTGRLLSLAMSSQNLGSPLSDSENFSDQCSIGSNGDINISDIAETLFGDMNTEDTMAEDLTGLDDLNSLFAEIASMPLWSELRTSYSRADPRYSSSDS